MGDPFRLAFDVWKDARPPLARHLSQVDLEASDELLADRSGAATPRVMVFGAYNAGKSTLINALVGQEVAPVADHPETACVTSYPWRGFMLDDTPGIDAPAEHEQVTRAHLETADVVLFMLSTDGTLEEQRTYDEIVAILRSGRPIRIILNNKTGLAADGQAFLDLRDKVSDNLRKAAVAAGLPDAEARVPIRLVNALRGFRGRQEGKPAFVLASGLPELEADLIELCAATGKGDMARTACRRIVRQIDFALDGFPLNDSAQQIRDVADKVSAERTRLSAVLGHAAQEAAASFEIALAHAVSAQSAEEMKAASNDAVAAVSSIMDRELRKTQRVFEEIGQSLSDTMPVGVAPAVPLFPVSGQQEAGGGGPSSYAKLVGPGLQALTQLNSKALVGGFMAAKQVFPSALKGLGPSFAGRIVPFVGPAVQMVSGIYNAISAHYEEQRASEREKVRRLAVAQQITDAGRRMRWALDEQCQDVIEQCFGPVEQGIATQTRDMRAEDAALEADRALLLRCKGRLEIALAP